MQFCLSVDLDKPIDITDVDWIIQTQKQTILKNLLNVTKSKNLTHKRICNLSFLVQTPQL